MLTIIAVFKYAGISLLMAAVARMIQIFLSPLDVLKLCKEIVTSMRSQLQYDVVIDDEQRVVALALRSGKITHKKALAQMRKIVKG